jgi:O-antigen ligase
MAMVPELGGRDAGRPSGMPTFFHAGIAVALAWGALAFGAVYDWAFWPLALVATVCGLTGLTTRVAGSSAVRPVGSTNAPLVFCLAALAAAIVLQLAPMPLDLLARVSPRAASVLTQLDVPFASGLLSRHPMTISPGATTTALSLYVAFAVLMLGVARVASAAGPRTLAAVICTLGVVVALVGIISKPFYAGKIYGIWEPLMGGRPFGPFVNPNHFAGWMLMALPVTFGLLCAVVARAAPRSDAGWRDRVIWLSSPHASKAIVVGAAAIVMAVSLVLTMSRSGMMAFAVAVAITGWFATRRLPNGAKRTIVSAYLAGLVLLSVASVGAETISSRFGSANPATINLRLPIWRDTVAIARDFWLTGTGLNTYGVATLFYQTAEPEYHLREAHNDYLQLAAEGGLLLSIPVACAVVVFVMQVRRRFRGSQGSSYWIRLGAVTGIVAIALQSVVDFSLQMPGNAALFAVLGGLALHHDRSRRAEAVVVSGS